MLKKNFNINSIIIEKYHYNNIKNFRKSFIIIF